jgi:Uncharacterized protein conserved in bacteria C-term(DUF2220)
MWMPGEHVRNPTQPPPSVPPSGSLMTAQPDPPASAGTGDPSTAGGVTSDPLVPVLQATVDASRTSRVPLAELRAAFARFDPSGATLPDARQRLAAAISSLQDTAKFVLPSEARSSRGWERHLSPPLPLWVQRRAAPTAGTAVRPARVWRPELIAAAELARTAAEWDVVDRIDRWFAATASVVADHAMVRVPFRERSLELFGDEKRLDALIRTRLFTSGALTLELLRADVPPLPLAVQWATQPGPAVGRTGPLILTENHHTFASLLSAARRRTDAWGPVAVGYGSGNQLSASVSGIMQLDPLPDRVLYIGDVDLGGLQIAARVTAAAAALPLPHMEPALLLYRTLFARNLRGRGRDVSAEQARAASEWLLAPDLVDQAVSILQAGERLAQEALSFEVLLTLDRCL